MLQVFAIVLVPVAIGMLVRARAPHVAERLNRPVRILSVVVLVAVIAGAVLGERENIADYFVSVGLAVLAFNVAEPADRVRRAAPGRRRPAAPPPRPGFEIGIHNSTLAITIALSPALLEQHADGHPGRGLRHRHVLHRGGVRLPRHPPPARYRACRGGERGLTRVERNEHGARVGTHRVRVGERRSHMAAGTKDDPWVLKTPPGSSDYTMYKDEEADPPILVCQVGSTKLTYQLRAIEDLHAWLREQGDWVPLGAADENKDAADGTVEAWGRSADNPVGGWYGLRKGYRGRFGMYLPPLLEELGLAELTHDARNNRMRAR